jgi:hypothetical protein
MKTWNAYAAGNLSIVGKAGGLLLSLAVTAVSHAATSPAGRPVKFYETSAIRVASFFMPEVACAPTQLSICLPLSASGTGSFPNVEIATVAVSASFGRSTLCANPNAQAIYAFRNRSTTVDDISTYSINYRYEIQSAVLADPLLINPRTGMPFDGKISFSPLSVFTDQDFLGPQQRVTRTQKISSLDCAITLLSHSMLVNSYGLSATDAQRVMSQALTVRLFISANLIATDGGSYGMQLRIMGD